MNTTGDEIPISATQPLTRDELIVSRFVNDKVTAQVIAEEFNISRARVGQILNDAGVDSRAIQRMRTESRAAERDRTIRALALDIQSTALQLASAGVPRADIEFHLQTFRPSTDPALIGAAVDVLREEEGLVMDKSRNDQRVSESVLRSSVLYAVGKKYGLAASLGTAEVTMDPELSAETARVLSAGGVGSEDILEVLLVIHGASQLIQTDDTVTLPGTFYDETRTQFLADHPAPPAVKVPWPVGSLTISKRLGGSWNDALNSLGLKTLSAPEGFGVAQYTAEEYSLTIRDFISADVGTTYADYERWAQSERERGQIRPSGPAVRNAFNGWNEAIRSIGDPTRLARATERRSKRNDSDSTLESLIQQKQEEYDSLTDELARLSASGELTPEVLESIEQQKSLATATLHRYSQEEARWSAQVERWNEQDVQSDRQFKINLWLAISIGVSAAIVPLIVWVLERVIPAP